MNRLPRCLFLGTLVAAAVGYFGIYAYYRFLDDDAVFNYVGAYGHGGSTFTLNKHSRGLGDLCIGESFSGESIVSRLSTLTGMSVAPAANLLFDPLARVDHLFTGRFIRFNDQVAQPVFPTSKLTTGLDSQFSIDSALIETVEFHDGL